MRGVTVRLTILSTMVFTYESALYLTCRSSQSDGAFSCFLLLANDTVRLRDGQSSQRLLCYGPLRLMLSLRPLFFAFDALFTTFSFRLIFLFPIKGNISFCILIASSHFTTIIMERTDALLKDYAHFESDGQKIEERKAREAKAVRGEDSKESTSLSQLLPLNEYSCATKEVVYEPRVLHCTHDPKILLPTVRTYEGGIEHVSVGLGLFWKDIELNKLSEKLRIEHAPRAILASIPTLVSLPLILLFLSFCSYVTLEPLNRL